MKNNSLNYFGIAFNLFIIFLLLFSSSQAQNLLNLPESVVYDQQNHRYLVSNWGDGNVIEIDSNGTQDYFLTSEQCYAGLHIINNILYVACREYGVKGFDLTTGANTLNINIPEASNINDITADTSGNLYVSYPTGSKIYKVNISNQTYSTYADSGLDTPNGLYFDEDNNRLLIISYKFSSPIQAINLEDSSLSTIVSTNLHNLDGFTRDNEGNYYVSSWYNDAIYKFDNTFTNQPELFSTHPDDPADIYFNPHDNVLAVPLFFSHAVEFISVLTSIDGKETSNTPENFTLFQNYPNPFNPSTKIKFSIPELTFVTIKVFDVLGNEIDELVYEEKPAGTYEVEFNSRSLISETFTITSSVYFYQLKAGSYIETKKMAFVK